MADSPQVIAMRKMGMSDKEIANLLAYDNAVNHGADDYKLTPEQEKVSREARKTGTRKAPTVYKLDNTNGKRSRKENATKRKIIEDLFTFLNEKADFEVRNSEILNPERMIFFQSGSDNYEITLIQKRKPK